MDNLKKQDKKEDGKLRSKHINHEARTESEKQYSIYNVNKK